MFPMPATNLPPDPPPQGVNVPVGPSTILGSAGALTAFVVAIIALLEGDRSTETIGALVTGALLIGGVIFSRTSQANRVTEAHASTPTILKVPGLPAELEAAATLASAGWTPPRGADIPVRIDGRTPAQDAADPLDVADSVHPSETRDLHENGLT